MTDLNKCPNCRADVPKNIAICEWCGFVINQEGEKSIESISSNLEAILKTMKGIEHPTLFSSFKRNAKISMPIFAVAFFILGYKVSGWFVLPAIFFMFYALTAIFKKAKNEPYNLNEYKADFDEKVRNFHNLYGQNNKYKGQIQQYQNEWKAIQTSAKKGRIAEWVSYGIVLLVFTIAFLTPEPKTNHEIETELLDTEEAIMWKADSLLDVERFDLAMKELQNIKSAKNSMELKSKVQIKRIELALKEIGNRIDAGEVENAKSDLIELTWSKNSQDYESEQVEQQYYKKYLLLKNAVNKKLPPNKQIQIEDEFDF